jgi:hypothetical protein
LSQELTALKSSMPTSTDEGSNQTRRTNLAALELATVSARNKDLLTELTTLSDKYHRASEDLSTARLAQVHTETDLRSKQRKIDELVEIERVLKADAERSRMDIIQEVQRTDSVRFELQQVTNQLKETEEQLRGLRNANRMLQDALDEQTAISSEYQVSFESLCITFIAIMYGIVIVFWFPPFWFSFFSFSFHSLFFWL